VVEGELRCYFAQLTRGRGTMCLRS
jgi:hypothetical protein